MGIIHFDTSKITHIARIIISERKGKITPSDGVVIFTPSKKLEINLKKKGIIISSWEKSAI